jgi:hypothetical protein
MITFDEGEKQWHAKERTAKARLLSDLTADGWGV